jgi:hypothetical protein
MVDKAAKKIIFSSNVTDHEIQQIEPKSDLGKMEFAQETFTERFGDKVNREAEEESSMGCCSTDAESAPDRKEPRPGRIK